MTHYGKRKIVKTLLESGKLLPKEISVNYGISSATVYNVKRRLDEGVPLSHQKGAGRPNNLRSSIKLSILHRVRCKPYLSLRALASRTGNQASYQTVRRVLKDKSYNKPYPVQIPMLSEKNRMYRIEWAKKYEYSKKQWAQTIFLDEMSIWLSRGRLRMWTNSNKKRIAPQRSMSQRYTCVLHSHLWVHSHCAFSLTI
ncbi:hypothetical protein LOD99_12039 [Oopsacas minuta]|uniref:Transposase Tc1-like domain-containing protein n=1 Tax=Oopsacas minuta TaxID=111878 RepID=A0AAV7JIH9_9METZ|nr:hypothetical protein LOD99_12039 [Oopsacas minuta]